ncbi:fumarylacetoacetate hydrolase family protein [Vibrio sp.]|uniref:FAA hydrolase family protein n=1 Tax=Vibrio viridaestus TaxID=2487322 RepID=A0A3N9TLN6_9VIBR|nr:fumarylacetoacetate hydrolase family protein [Vibrio viridaestus]MDC0611952.1 fumarylacetoacetate hydrolase family protein [Vibrio sp.]RQW64904.1 FAA hydrolase family protein [Vibrio viridaestus]
MKQIKAGGTVVTPSKVVCVGRNYVEHIKELNNAIPEQMVLFNKPNASISSVLSSFHEEQLHYETEICFVAEKGKYQYVGLGLDLTKRGLQSFLKEKGLPWERAKAFNGSAVFSRFIPLDNIDIDSLSLELFINCTRVQCGGVKQMMYSPDLILSEIQTFIQLEDGDVIMTGTPKGVGMVHQGDAFLARLKSNDATLLEVEWIAQ